MRQRARRPHSRKNEMKCEPENSRRGEALRSTLLLRTTLSGAITRTHPIPVSRAAAAGDEERSRGKFRVDNHHQDPFTTIMDSRSRGRRQTSRIHACLPWFACTPVMLTLLASARRVSALHRSKGSVRHRLLFALRANLVRVQASRKVQVSLAHHLRRGAAHEAETAPRVGAGCLIDQRVRHESGKLGLWI